ncbi:MAG: hypothetical protein K2H09_09220 [Treponemataceae bacterium]|nr:hypothetical protein [Treponemataceae bacterium]
MEISAEDAARVPPFLAEPVLLPGFLVHWTQDARRNDKIRVAAEIGLGRTMERKLRAVGTSSAEELRANGSRAAMMRLKAAYPGTCAANLNKGEL